jgi:hypothetical protein
LEYQHHIQVRRWYSTINTDGKCEIIHWETTSLYGDINRWYHNMMELKPFVRYVDLTESENFLFQPMSTISTNVKNLRVLW